MATWTLGVLGSSLRRRFETDVVDTSPSEKGVVHSSSRFRFGRSLDAIRIFADLIRKLVRFRPQIVHINTPYRWAFARDGLAVWIASLWGVRTVLHFHGGDLQQFVEGTPRLLRFLIEVTLRRTDRLIALTRETEAFLRGIVDPDRVVYLPNFVRLEDIGLPPDRSARGNHPLEVLFVGWILKPKGVRELLEVAGAFPRVRFTLVGPVQSGFLESIRGELESARDHVRLLPEQPRQEVIRLYRRADVFALPTYREGFPNTVLEAMAAGLPVVATPVGAIPDAVRDGEEGVLVPPRDVPALRSALACLLEDRERRIELGARSRRRVESLFSLDVVVRQLESIYLGLIGDAT